MTRRRARRARRAAAGAGVTTAAVAWCAGVALVADHHGWTLRLLDALGL